MQPGTVFDKHHSVVTEVNRFNHKVCWGDLINPLMARISNSIELHFELSENKYKINKYKVTNHHQNVKNKHQPMATGTTH